MSKKSEDLLSFLIQDFEDSTPEKSVKDVNQEIFNEHINIVLKGKRAIDEWNSNHQGEFLDLQGAVLEEAELGAVNLSHSNLNRANLNNTALFKTKLRQATLTGASLNGAILVGADLTKAKLQNASLKKADLRKAILQGANLEDSNLTYANLNHADLSEAKLHRAKVRCANLREANLSGANLRNANIQHSDLSRAYLARTDLNGASLRSTNLRSAIIVSANLTTANLHSANLESADLTGSNLEHTKLSFAFFGGTVIKAVDLSKTKGLNKIIHNKPSLIDKDTFDFSKTKIPSSLLRNCGLSRSFINSITPTGISNRYFSCLIVYATKDEAFAELLHEYLQKKGIQSQLSAKDWKTETKNQQITTEEVVFFERVLFIQSENSQKTGWNNRDLGSIILNTHESKKDILVPLYSRICKDEFKLRTKELDLELIADLEKMSE